MKRTNLIVLALCGLAALPLRLFAAGDPPLRPSAKADKVVVLKSERKLLLMNGDEVLKTYRISLGGSPVGPKMRQGDQKTPEGQYVLDRRNAKSEFYKAMHISYPNDADLARAKRLGVSPGGNLFVHGNGVGRWQQVTGCETGPMAASRSPTRRWTRSGGRRQTGPQSRSSRDGG